VLLALDITPAPENAGLKTASLSIGRGQDCIRMTESMMAGAEIGAGEIGLARISSIGLIAFFPERFAMPLRPTKEG
jgi:hypothetical protein